MIVFSAFLVVAAVALLVAGVVTSKLWLVYVAIGVSGVSLLALGLGVILKRNELFGQAKQAEPAELSPVPAQVPAAPRGSRASRVEPDLDALPQPAAAPAGYRWSAVAQPGPQPGPSRAGYLPSDHSMGTRPPAVQPSPAAGRPQPQPGRPADYERPPAAFTPRPAAGTPSPVPAVWEWRDTPPPAPPPAESDQPSAQVEQPAGSGEPTDQNLPASTDDQQAESQRTTPPQDQTGPDQAAEDQAAEDQATEDQATEDQQQAPVEQEPEPAQDEQGTAADQPAPASAAEPGHGPEPAPAEVDLLREVTVVPGVPRYHNAQCILIRFMGEDDLNRMPLGEARQAGCTPCRACQPDQP